MPVRSTPPTRARTGVSTSIAVNHSRLSACLSAINLRRHTPTGNVLEAATVAADQPPSKVLDFNEGHFEEAAQLAHQRWGIASPVTLNQCLAEFGF
jgi:hypothetical protein